ncbi:MAG TPA: hypothetical protein VL854_06760 [Nitrososphaeraceae archaeon]|nr:hypothetical protein [Nitrososphaeraceae archaeon]
MVISTAVFMRIAASVVTFAGLVEKTVYTGMRLNLTDRTVLEELHIQQLGTIIAYDSEEGDFGIITGYPVLTQMILDEYRLKYSKTYNKNTFLYSYEFNIYYKEEQV